MTSQVFMSGIPKDSSNNFLEKQIEKIFIESTNNLSWLKKGDKVLLKPALNSPDKYPSTTHPLCIKVIAKVLTQRGAEVIVADQSGIEHVVQDETGIVFGSSKENYKVSGMSESGIDFVALEEKGWNYFKKVKPKNSAWKNGFYISKIIDDVDHIINLPRISTHSMTGVTLGLKNFVGLLRQDSRIEFHNDGPFSFMVNNHAKRSKSLKIDYENENKFFEKISEISLAVKDKLRLTFFVATELQLTIGPDRRVVKVFKTYIDKPQTGLIIASADILAADATALAFLISEYNQLNFFQKIPNKFLLMFNDKVKEPGKESLWENKFLMNAKKLKLGNQNFEIRQNNIPNEILKNINKELHN